MRRARDLMDREDFLRECLPCGSQCDAIRILCGFRERGADGVFELVDLVGEDGFSDAEVFGGLVEVVVSGNRRKLSTTGRAAP